jgi:hypothetical protein
MPSAWHSMSASRPRPPLNEIAACTARSAKAAGKQFNALVSGKIKRLEITNTIPTWKHIRFLGHRSNDLARQAPSEMNFPFGPTSSANYHNRSQRFSVDKGLHSNRVSSNRRLCFRETEFCAQRQRRRNHSAKFTENPGRDELTPQLGQLRASYRTAGKSLRKSECVVADAVPVEPVSSHKIPGNREISANFGRMFTPGGFWLTI